MLGKNAAVPLSLVHEAFVATPLTTDLFALDYAAYTDRHVRTLPLTSATGTS